MKSKTLFLTLTSRVLIFLLLICSTHLVLADEDEGGGRANIGPDKAITKYDMQNGLQFSPSALKEMGIQKRALEGGKSFSIPKSALVYFQNETGIYRYQSGWFKLIKVTVLSKADSLVRIESPTLKSNDEIVVAGTPMLRVADLEASGGSSAEEQSESPKD